MRDIAVKLDAELKKKIESYISKDLNRFDYPSVKNFVDKAVFNALKELGEYGKKRNK